MKKLIRASMKGIGLATCIFCVMCVIFDQTEGGRLLLEDYRMTRMAVGAILCGIGWGAPSVIYEKEGLSMPVKVLIHMGTGCVVYTVVAFAVSWLGTNTTLGQKLLIIAIQLLIAFAIWMGFHLYYKHEARQIDEKIRGRRQEEADQYVAVDQSVKEEVRGWLDKSK